MRPRVTLKSIAEYHRSLIRNRTVVRRGAEELKKKAIRKVTKLT
jgi:hypothetical protein